MFYKQFISEAKQRISSVWQSLGNGRRRWSVVGLVVLLGVVFIWILPAACGEHRPMGQELDKLEELVEKDPYAALERLDSISEEELDSPEARARHILLTARARHRCYIDETNDSLISIAVDYFSKHPSISAVGVSRKVLALYQQGVIRENDGSYLLALDSFLKAEAEAVPLEEHYFLGYIYRHIGLLYEHIHAGKESVYYGKKSFEEFSEAGSTPNIAYAVSELSVAYHVYCQYDSAQIWADKCLALPYVKTDTQLQAEALRNAGRASLKQGDIREAIGYYSTLQSLGSEQFGERDAWYLARAYQADGQGAKAYAVCREYLGADTAKELIPYEILYSRGDIDGAFRAIKREFDRDSTVTIDYSRQNLTRALAEFREQEIMNQGERHRRDTAVWILGCCLFLAVMVIILMGMSRKMRRSRKELTSLMTTMENLNSELRGQLRVKDNIISEKENENAQARQSYYSLLERQIQQIDEMTTLFREPTSTVENRRLFKRIEKLKTSFSDPRFLARMEQEVNTFHGDIMRRFRSEFPMVKEEEVILFLYQVCGFSGRTITFLTGEELTHLYPRRSRLKKQILLSEAPSRTDFLQYFS